MISPPATIVSLYRYPVKGLGPQELAETELSLGETVRLDRAWAIENGPGRFDAEHPKHLPKINFLMLMRNERLAALQTEFDEASRTLALFRNGRQVVKGGLESRTGRLLIEQFIAGYMPADLRGAPRIVCAPDHSFSDVDCKCLHIVNLASVRELERVTGAKVDPLRFRANVYVEAHEPWVEVDWVGKAVGLGPARVEVFDRTSRCEATNVDPATGARDMAIPQTLTRAWGHQDFGVYATVAEGGRVKRGDTVAAP